MNYDTLRREMLHGFNTFDTYSVLSHVLLPQGFAIKLCLKSRITKDIMYNALIGRFGENDEHIKPGVRTVDGSYTQLKLEFEGAEFDIRSSGTETDQYVLVTPLNEQCGAMQLFVQCGFLWNKPGQVFRKDGHIRGEWENGGIDVFLTNSDDREMYSGSFASELACDLYAPAAVSTGRAMSVEEVSKIIEKARIEAEKSADKYGELKEAYIAMRTGYAWNTIYEPAGDRLCSPVSRIWNVNWGGYVLFEWDTFFAASMSSLESKEIAYANLFSILNEATENGIIPNFGAAHDNKSRDRTEPPVGCLTVYELYERFHEKWILEESYEPLLKWNRWFRDARMQADGTLCWGSDPYEDRYAKYDFNNMQGAMYESGLDNSPMFDDAVFDSEKHIMMQSDVGLTALYAMECKILAKIAEILGRDERDELLERAEKCCAGLEGLWDEEFGLYRNRDLVTGKFSDHIGPTCFYPGLAGCVSPEKAAKMAKHYFDPKEFYGEFVMPAIARNDPAYPDQTYWRGRIWAPMNYLAYLSFRNMGLSDVCADLAEKSEKMLLQEWHAHGHIHENYSGDDGWGCPNPRSDKFYHWGGLLAYIALIEKGYISTAELK